MSEVGFESADQTVANEFSSHHELFESDGVEHVQPVAVLPRYGGRASRVKILTEYTFFLQHMNNRNKQDCT